MAVVITKRRKAYNVIYTIQNENGDIEKIYENPFLYTIKSYSATNNIEKNI